MLKLPGLMNEFYSSVLEKYNFYLSRCLIITVYLLMLSLSKAYCTDYFVSNTGNDQDTGTSTSSAWKTLAHVSEISDNLKPGDRILLERGSKFHEALILSGLFGTSAQPITIGAYGTGVSPVISGAVQVVNWTRVDGNIWRASCPDCPNDPAAVFMDDTPLPIGRYPNIDAPNRGYMIIDQSHDFLDNKIVIDNELSGQFPDNYWQGAKVVTRTRRWLLDRARISSHTGNTINLSEKLTYGVQKDYGYFIQSHYKTLDQDEEWFFDGDTKELFVFLDNKDPNNFNVEVTNLETVLSISGSSYVTVQDITFEKGSEETVKFTTVDHGVFTQNKILCSGRDGLSLGGYGSTSLLVDQFEVSHNYIEHSLNTGLMFFGKNSNLHDNQIYNSAMIPGMGESGNQQQSGAYISGNDNVFEYNKIVNSGYNGIHFKRGPWDIRYNLVDGYCATKDDGGGIYTYGATAVSNKISYNIVLNGIGAPEGSHTPDRRADRGLYADGGSSNIIYDHNTVSNSWEGMLIHVSNSLTVTNNTFEGSLSHALRINQSLDNGTEHPDLRNLSIQNNLLMSSQDLEALYKIQSYRGDVASFGTVDNNLVCQPTQTLSPAYPYVLEMEQNPNYPSYGLDYWHHTLENLAAKSPYGKHDRASPVAFDKYTIVSKVSDNLLDNSELDYHFYEVTSWSKESTDDSKFRANRSDDGVMDGPSIKAWFLEDADGVEGKVLYKNLQFDEGDYYAFSYDIKGSNTSQVIVKAITLYGEEVHALRTFMVTPDRTHHQFIFKAKSTTDKGRLYFDLTADNGEVWLDNLQMYKVAVKENTLVKVEYNESKTVKEIAVVGTYYDVEGNLIPSKVTLQPYESLVMVRDPEYVIPEEPETSEQPEAIPVATSLDAFPWKEEFDLANYTFADDQETGWKLDTVGVGNQDLMGTQEQRLTFNRADEPVFFYSNKINIQDKGTVGLAIDIKKQGGLESEGLAKDFLYAYYSLDSGVLKPVIMQDGNLPKDDTWYRYGVKDLQGKYLEIVIAAKTTAIQESFSVDNILVDTNNNIAAHLLAMTSSVEEPQANNSGGEEQAEENLPEDDDDVPQEENNLNGDGSEVRIYAAGLSGSETMELWIGDEQVKSWNNVIGDINSRKLVQYVYQHTALVEKPQLIKIVFSGGNGEQSELMVDKMILDGKIYETEAYTTYSTGTEVDGNCSPGYKESESLNCAGGYFQYGLRQNTLTGIDEFPEKEKVYVQAYPNPAGQFLYIQFVNTNSAYARLEVLDVLGKIRKNVNKISTHEVYRLSMGQLKTGIYHVRILGEAGETEMIRVIKK